MATGVVFRTSDSSDKAQSGIRDLPSMGEPDTGHRPDGPGGWEDYRKGYCHKRRPARAFERAPSGGGSHAAGMTRLGL